MLVAYAWVMLAGFLVQLVPNVAPGPLPAALAWTVLGLGLVQCLSCTGVLHQALDSYLGTRVVTGAQLALPASTVVAMTALTVALVALDAVEGGVTVGLALYGTLAPFAVTFGVAVPRRTAALALCGYLAAVPCALAAAGMPGSRVLVAGVVAGLGGLVSVFTGRSSAWYIAVIRELQEARGAQARLAVAEERLRFSRDLHDVMGRNLSAIALKSELAAQLVRRGASAEASAEQMTQVQHIARESQSEVRAVVRGYRDVDLPTELAGARGILRAAGVDCRTDNGGSRLPARVQAALGWVVREGATNVLRHADATWCTVWVGTDSAGGSALLVMENDGVRGAAGGGARGASGWGSGSGWGSAAGPGAGAGVGSGSGAGAGSGSGGAVGSGPGSGSGLAGLRERLDGVGGTLRAEPGGGSGTFRLTAEVPLGTGDGTGTGTGSGATGGTDGKDTAE
nr:histidine kinase [Streptomyces sp. HNM0575]